MREPYHDRCGKIKHPPFPNFWQENKIPVTFVLRRRLRPILFTPKERYMPRRGTSDAPLTIGVWGYGEASQESVEEVLGDLTERHDGNVRFLFLVTSDSLSDSLQHAVDFAIDPDILTEDDEALTLDFEVVTDAESKQDRPVKEILHAAVKSSIVQDPEKRFLDLLDSAPRAHFAVLLDEEDDATTNMVFDAMNRGLDVFDLTQQYIHLLPPEDEGGADRDSEEEVHVDDGISEALEETVVEETATFTDSEGNPVSDFSELYDAVKGVAVGLREWADELERAVKDAQKVEKSNGHTTATKPAEAPKKKRGRPSKTETVTQRAGKTAKAAAPANGEAPRRRGRPPMPRDKDGKIIRTKV